MNTDKTINLVKTYFNSKNYNIEYINIQKNSINGIIYCGKLKCFFKILEIKEMNNEITGYLLLKNKYPVCSIVEKIYFSDFRNTNFKL